MKPDLIATSQKALQAAINFRAAKNEMQKLAGGALTGNEADALTERLLATSDRIASLAPKPFMLSAPGGSEAPKDPPDTLSAIALVLGQQTLHTEQITKSLLDKGWLPNTPRSVRYVSDLLSRNSEGNGTNQFARVRRGTYKIAKARRKLVFKTGP